VVHVVVVEPAPLLRREVAVPPDLDPGLDELGAEHAPRPAHLGLHLHHGLPDQVELLRRALRHAVNADASFNRITVDTDTSTSDTVAVLANGQAGNHPIREADATFDAFTEALTELCRALAYQVISDGEGVNHVIRVRVAGAAGGEDARRVARAVADSPLVKTAVHGHDPNWGRIAAAVGRSGARVEPAKLMIKIGRITVFKAGEPATFDQAAVSERMNRPEVMLEIDLGLGPGTSEILGCDLSRDYIAINADYTT